MNISNNLPTFNDWHVIKNTVICHEGKKIQVIKQAKPLTNSEFHTNRFLAVLALIFSLGLAYFAKSIQNLLTKTYQSRSISFEITKQEEIKIDQIAGKTIPLHAGFTNGGNTCFLATSLQAIKAIDSTIQFRKFHLEREQEESEAKFQDRCSLRDYIIKLLSLSEIGITISAKQMHKLHKLMHKVHHPYFVPNHGSSPSAALTCMLKLLYGNDPKSINVGLGDEAEEIFNINSPHYLHYGEIDWRDDFTEKQLQEAELLTLDANPEDHGKGTWRDKPVTEFLEAYPTIELHSSDEKKKHNFELLGFTCSLHSGKHETVYIKNSKDNNFVYCNDSQVDNVAKISPQHINTIDSVIYKKMTTSVYQSVAFYTFLSS